MAGEAQVRQAAVVCWDCVFQAADDGGDAAAVAEAVDSSEAWKAARVLRSLALSWEGWEEAVPAGWRPPTERVAGGWTAPHPPGSPSLTLARPLCWVRGGGVACWSFGLALHSVICLISYRCGPQEGL